MAVDHMLFNKLKWFNVADDANEVTINHKSWTAHPASVTVKEDSYLIYVSDPVVHNLEDLKTRGQQDFKCIGKAGNLYIVSGYFKTYDSAYNKRDFNSETVVFTENSVISERWT